MTLHGVITKLANTGHPFFARFNLEGTEPQGTKFNSLKLKVQELLEE